MWVGAAVGGAVYGTAGTITHAYRLGVVPVGLLLALVGLTALMVAVRALTRDRWAVLACGIGAFGTTVLFSGTGPGGSVLVPGGGLDEIAGVSLGMVWAIGVALAATLVIAWPDLSRLRARSGN